MNFSRLSSFIPFVFGLSHCKMLAGHFIFIGPSLPPPFPSALRAYDFHFLLLGLHLLAFDPFSPFAST